MLLGAYLNFPVDLDHFQNYREILHQVLLLEVLY